MMRGSECEEPFQKKKTYYTVSHQDKNRQDWPKEICEGQAFFYISKVLFLTPSPNASKDSSFTIFASLSL